MESRDRPLDRWRWGSLQALSSSAPSPTPLRNLLLLGVAALALSAALASSPSCSPPSADEAVQPLVENDIPTPTPQRAPPAQLGQTRVQGVPVLLRVLTPSEGAEQAKAAIAAGLAEAKRVTGLSAADRASPELEASRGSLRALAEAAQLAVSEPSPGILVAYAVDRSADVLLAHGMTDFLIDAGTLLRAHGSQDARHGRGWKVGTGPRSDRSSSEANSVVLHNQALAHLPETSPPGRVAAARAPTAGLATAAALLASAASKPPWPHWSSLGVEAVARIGRGE